MMHQGWRRNGLDWIDVKDGTEAHGKTKMNQREIDAVAAQLERMQQNLKGHKPPMGETWSVAVLTFYVGQERELRKRLKKITARLAPRSDSATCRSNFARRIDSRA